MVWNTILELTEYLSKQEQNMYCHNIISSVINNLLTELNNGGKVF